MGAIFGKFYIAIQCKMGDATNGGGGGAPHGLEMVVASLPNLSVRFPNGGILAQSLPISFSSG